MLHHQHILRFVTLWHLLLSTGTAQSHSRSNPQLQSAIETSLVFVPWDADVSVVAVDPTVTTYLQDNPNPSRNKSNTINCHPEAYDRVTIVNGPSTAGVTIFYTECGPYPAYSYRLECPLTEPNTAICSQFLTSGDSTQTMIETANSSELSPQPCTITAGIEKLGPMSATVATTSDRGTSVPQTAFSFPTSSTGSAQSPASSTTGEGSCFMVPFGKAFVVAAVAALWSVM